MKDHLFPAGAADENSNTVVLITVVPVAAVLLVIVVTIAAILCTIYRTSKQVRRRSRFLTKRYSGIVDTIGPFVLCREVVLFRRLLCREVVLFRRLLCREVVLFRRLLCREVVLFRRLLCREVVLFQRLLYTGYMCILEYIWCVLCWEVCPLLECPLLEVSLYNS